MTYTVRNEMDMIIQNLTHNCSHVQSLILFCFFIIILKYPYSDANHTLLQVHSIFDISSTYKDLICMNTTSFFSQFRIILILLIDSAGEF